MEWKKRVESWLSYESLEATLKTDLTALVEDEEALEDAFYQPLTFGTGGMRGLLGPGINRMNIYTVRKAAKGLALFLEKKYETFGSRGVVVAYDSRHFSKEFAIETARGLGIHGIQTYIFSS